jgi:hypothetical protein
MTHYTYLKCKISTMVQDSSVIHDEITILRSIYPNFPQVYFSFISLDSFPLCNTFASFCASSNDYTICPSIISTLTCKFSFLYTMVTSSDSLNDSFPLRSRDIKYHSDTSVTIQTFYLHPAHYRFHQPCICVTCILFNHFIVFMPS